jgi:hypothetical protein
VIWWWGSGGKEVAAQGRRPGSFQRRRDAHQSFVGAWASCFFCFFFSGDFLSFHRFLFFVLNVPC